MQCTFVRERERVGKNIKWPGLENGKLTYTKTGGEVFLDPGGTRAI
jgi:hypothetical protein